MFLRMWGSTPKKRATAIALREWTALQGFDWNLWGTYENLLNFFKFSEKTKYQHCQIVEKFRKEKYFSNTSGSTDASFH